MTLRTERYPEQSARWPRRGRTLLAQFDDESIVVYQAYSPAIGHDAAANGRFGGSFSFARMSWIKPSFLWMMYRSGWGTKENQEVTLAVRLRRSAFDRILAAAADLAPDVRLQWDPDHHPSGAPLERRAIQLGLRGESLRRYAADWLVGIEDISELVAAERPNAAALDALVTPREDIYPVPEPLAARLGILP